MKASTANVGIRERKTFTFINNERLCEIIESASRHIIYAAPSITESVARSLCKFAGRNTETALRVIVDADAEAFRLGFGEHAALNMLMGKEVDIRCSKGLRIATLIADKDAWVYAPTPEIIFEQPTAAINNAIKVSVEFAEQILLSIAPDISFKAAKDTLSESIVVDGSTIIPDAETKVDPVGANLSHENEDEVLNATILAVDLIPEIGTEALTPKDLAQVGEELKENPPQKFDAARKVRVYQGYFQFVDLSLTGCRLTAHTINIPKSLLNIAEDSDMQKRVRSTCRLVDDTSEFSRKVKLVEDKVRKLRDDYIKPLGKRYGSVILRKQRIEFDKQVALIQEDLKALSATIKEELGKEIKCSREKLITMLLPGFMKAPPQKLKSQLFTDLDEKIAQQFIGDELDKEIPTVDKLVGEMQLNCDYKDVTFEMLNDEKFIKAVESRFKFNSFAKLYSEQETIGQR